MRILVTGGAGFIGSHVVDSYVARGHRVAVIDDLSTGKKENLNPDSEFYHIGIGSPEVEKVFNDFKPDIVNHHAAQIDVRKSVSDPVHDAKINILDAIKLLEHCNNHKVKKFIYASTGGAIYGEPEHIPCDESHPVRPLAGYGTSKYCFEQYLELYSRLYGLDYTILRYANVYGPRQDPFGEAGVVAIFCGRLLSEKSPVIFGDGEQTRDYVYVGDIAKANLLVLDRGSGMCFNLGTGIQTSVNQIFRQIVKILGSDIKPVYEAPRPGEVMHIALDAGKAKNVIGWEPDVSIEEGLNKTLEFFKQQPK
ncbi:MAG: NAD-dependent epimerase/dehydratase family protein [Candidatus Eremiobacteraeota bacterium]|nr:NAD-dependent epimerase/dehydratase family protein [Candidatus Eremiobacteraeota bacterium]